jgi:hypothetical protein
MKNLYNRDQQCHIQIRQLMAIAFCPLAILRNVLHQFETDADPRLAQLFEYFRNQWMVAVSPILWNVHGIKIRTNNDLESWHSRFQNMLSKHHPNIWVFLEYVIQEQCATEVSLHQIAAGQQVNAPSGKYKALRKDLRQLLRRYRRGDFTAMQYITAVSNKLVHYH